MPAASPITAGGGHWLFPTQRLNGRSNAMDVLELPEPPKMRAKKPQKSRRQGEADGYR
jgi:hypothetical protein